MGCCLALLILLVLPLLASAQLDPVARERWLEAVSNNRLSTLESMLGQVQQVDLRDAKGKTALMAAAAGGSRSLAEALIERGADPHALNSMNSSTLVYAAWSGDLAVLELFLDHGVDVDRQARNGWGPLMMATAKRQAEALARLCEAGADPNLPDVYLWTPLMRAAYEGYTQALQQLLACPGVDLAPRNERGQTALHLAVIHGDVAIVQLLLERGMDPGEADFAGNTPASIAQELAHEAILGILPINHRTSAGG